MAVIPGRLRITPNEIPCRDYEVHNFKKASEIPEFCTQLAKLLQFQKLFCGTGIPVKYCKVVELHSADDAVISVIFSENPKSKIEDIMQRRAGVWHINSFSNVNYPYEFMGRNGMKKIPHGVYLIIYKDLQLSSLEELKKNYNQVYQKLITDWTRANPDDHPGMLFRENAEDFDLFIKSREKTIWREDELLRVLAKKFGLEKSVTCMNNWLVDSKLTFGDTYLWVRKTELDNVKDVFGLKLD